MAVGIDTPDQNGNHHRDRAPRQPNQPIPMPRCSPSNEGSSSTSGQVPTLSRSMMAISEPGSAVEGKLHVVGPLAFVEPEHDALGVRLGIKLASSADVAAIYLVEEFTFRVAGMSFPMSAEPPFEQLAPGAEQEWWRDTLLLRERQFPGDDRGRLQGWLRASRPGGRARHSACPQRRLQGRKHSALPDGEPNRPLRHRAPPARGHAERVTGSMPDGTARLITSSSHHYTRM